MRVRVEKVRSKHLWSTFQSDIPLIFFFPPVTSGFTWNLFPLRLLEFVTWRHSEMDGCLTFLFLAPILPLWPKSNTSACALKSGTRRCSTLISSRVGAVLYPALPSCTHFVLKKKWPHFLLFSKPFPTGGCKQIIFHQAKNNNNNLIVCPLLSVCLRYALAHIQLSRKCALWDT